MKRALIYLFIFALAANVAAFSIAFLSDPLLEHGQSSNSLVATFLVTIFIALSLTLGLIISVIKTFMPNPKLPHLLIRDNIILAGILSLGATGLLVLQLLRAATVRNILLWLVVVVAILWIVRSLQKAIDQPSSK